jgi:hypothetical protein
MHSHFPRGCLLSPRTPVHAWAHLIVMSTLKSVVGDYHFTRWDVEKLDSDDALAQFHEKFWGVSMNEGANDSEENGETDGEQDDAGANEEEGEGEEEEYEYEGQYEGGDGTDEDEEEEGEEGDGEDEEEERGEEGDGDDAENEEEEEEGEEEDEDDFIDGCCVLDIGIDDIETSIWIRAEYIRFYNHIATLFEEVVEKERKDKKSSCVILTGQPGIGEFHC